MPMWVRHSGTWRKVDAGGLRVRHSGSWRTVDKAWVRHSGTWRQFYVRSDPLTVNLYPNWTRTYMYNGGRAWGTILSGVDDNDMLQGYWETSQGTVPGPSGTWSYVTSVMDFSDLNTHLATRPVIKSLVLRMTLKVGYGGTPLSSRLVLGGTTTTATAPATLAHTDAAKGLQETTATVWTGEGQTKSVALNDDMLNSFQSLDRRGIALHDNSHGSSETRKRETRTIWHAYDAATSVRPMLTATLDYV